MKRYLPALCAVLIALGLTACSMQNAQTVPATGGVSGLRPLDTQGGIANTDVDLGDAAPVVSGRQLAHLDLGVREIDVTDAQGNVQVIAAYASPLVVDVLQYQDGTGADVGQASLAGQTYQQIRFVIDVGSSQAIFADNSVARLVFPTDNNGGFSTAGAGAATSTAQAGAGQVAISDNQQFSIFANVGQIIGVDFNAFESLGPGSGNTIVVRPALFVATSSSAGTITGSVVNASGSPVANATIVAVGSAGNVGNTAASDSSGNFQLHTLPSDTYRLDIYNAYTNTAGARFASAGATSSQNVIRGPTITVSPGANTSAGSITD